MLECSSVSTPQLLSFYFSLTSGLYHHSQAWIFPTLENPEIWLCVPSPWPGEHSCSPCSKLLHPHNHRHSYNKPLSWILSSAETCLCHKGLMGGLERSEKCKALCLTTATPNSPLGLSDPSWLGHPNGWPPHRVRGKGSDWEHLASSVLLYYSKPYHTSGLKFREQKNRDTQLLGLFPSSSQTS